MRVQTTINKNCQEYQVVEENFRQTTTMNVFGVQKKLSGWVKKEDSKNLGVTGIISRPFTRGRMVMGFQWQTSWQGFTELIQNGFAKFVGTTTALEVSCITNQFANSQKRNTQRVKVKMRILKVLQVQAIKFLLLEDQIKGGLH